MMLSFSAAARALGVGEQPGEEVLGGLLVTFSGLGVDRQVVLGADGDVGLSSPDTPT